MFFNTHLNHFLGPLQRPLEGSWNTAERKCSLKCVTSEKNIPLRTIYQNNPSAVSLLVSPCRVPVTDRWANVILLLPQSWWWAVNLDLGFRATVWLKPNLTEWLSTETKTSECSRTSSRARTWQSCHNLQSQTGILWHPVCLCFFPDDIRIPHHTNVVRVPSHYWINLCRDLLITALTHLVLFTNINNSLFLRSLCMLMTYFSNLPINRLSAQ